ncbi:MAG: sporulation protein [Methanobacterium sp.]|jgi:uncharacterized spore protein YtfJ|nr:sporulation protein [Methanobacterium sp.]
MDIGDPIKTTVEEIRKVLNIENVIGEVIEADDKTLIPVSRMGMGFGAGGGEGKGRENMGGSGAGAGGAAGIEPIAMIVVFKGVEGPEGVKVLTLSGNPIAQALGELGTAAMDAVKTGVHEMKKSGKDKEMKQKAEEKVEEVKSKMPGEK